jgi:ABC-type thiamin/hydroxymethylpyrimidine transport system permease subunit
MNWDWIVSACLGVGLAACCGFRVFVPMLVAGIATKLGMIGTMGGFEWISTWPALMLLGVATLVELGAYYIPWLDNALDTIAGPAAIIAGTVLSTSFLQVDSPVLDWGLGLMLGGGSAGLIQAGTSLLRLGSTATTGGLGNPVVSTGENAASFGFSILAVLMPLVCVVIIALILTYIIVKLVSRRRVTFTKPVK